MGFKEALENGAKAFSATLEKDTKEGPNVVDHVLDFSPRKAFGFIGKTLGFVTGATLGLGDYLLSASAKKVAGDIAGGIGSIFTSKDDEVIAALEQNHAMVKDILDNPKSVAMLTLTNPKLLERIQKIEIEPTKKAKVSKRSEAETE